MRTALWVKTGSYDNLCLYKLIVDFSVILWQMVLKETFSSKLIFSLYNPYQIEIVQTSPLRVVLQSGYTELSHWTKKKVPLFFLNFSVCVVNK